MRLVIIGKDQILRIETAITGVVMRKRAIRRATKRVTRKTKSTVDVNVVAHKTETKDSIIGK